MQVIGNGGFSRELQAYCWHKNVDTYVYEYHTNPRIVWDRGAIIAIGSEEVRRQIVDELPKQLWGVLNFASQYGRCEIGHGSIVCPNTILTTDIIIGKHCLVNISCTIGHDVTIGDFVTINPGVNISGNVRIGGNVNIGTNSVIRNGISICDDVTVGAGAVIVKDITEPGIYVGNPCVRMDKRPKYTTESDVTAIISNLNFPSHKQLTPPPKATKNS